jgi:hypothetical protein
MLRQSISSFAVIAAAIFCPAPAWATQTHGGLEGLYVHQFAHLFFAFSMGLLIYWLRIRQLVASAAWCSIQYAALFFIAWNCDAMVSHWLVEQSGLIAVRDVGGMHIQIATPQGMDWIAIVYYFTKLDHLLCVPALIFLFLGLKRLLKNAQQVDAIENQPL